MPSNPTGWFCPRHGGTLNPLDAYWGCDTCARSGIDKCKCDGHARHFGEALMGSVSCESCDESVAGVDVDARKLWNAGVRGWVGYQTPEERQ